MKKGILRVMAIALAMVLILAMFASCGQQGEQGPAGPKGVQGEKGDDGNGISSIIKTSTEGLVDTYTITFTDSKTTIFTVTNGADGEQGIQGIQGVKGEDGHTPVITIQNGYWYIDGVNTNQSAAGVSGATGNGISNIAKTSTEGLVDTYTITYTNGTTTTFTVTNGAQGIQGIQGVPGKDGHSPVITIQDGYWYIDGVNTNEEVSEGIKGDTGNGISSIAKTNTEGLVDTYTITFTDGTTTTFTITNGADGNDGKDGINGTNGKDGVDGEDGKDGQDGTDGQTPYIKDGYWWIGDINTNVKAEGTDGKDGQNGTNGKDGVDGEDGKDGQDGADGQTPYIKDGYWWIGDANTNVKAEGTDGKDGQDGAKGDKGDTGATGATGEKGDKGDAGRGIKRMWLDADLHLWVEYDDGSAPVDLGYVGVTTTEPIPTTYTVTFVDYNGTELKKETVESGNSATAPADPTRAGYRFTGWDVAFNNITSNTTVTAQYIQQFTVTFKDYDGSTLKTQTVDKGSNATPPANPSRDGYEFKSWSGTYTNVTADQVVTATYTQNASAATYTVTFYDYDGTTILGTSSVAEGKAATPPTNPSKSGATFLGWNGNYANVTKNESVVAVYDDSKNIFTVESATGSVGDTVTLLVSVDGTVKTCGFDITIYYDNAILELVSYDSDLDLDVVVNTEYLDNGVLLNFSAATEKTKSREIIELTFRIKDTTADATRVYVEMTSVKEMDGSTIIDSTCEFVDGVVTIQ